MNCISDRIPLTDEQIEARFEAAGESLAIGYGDEDRVTVTSETLAEWLASTTHWNEPGRIVVNRPDAVRIERAQVAKGQERGAITIIDCGDLRLVYA